MYISIGRTLPRNRQVFSIIKRTLRTYTGLNYSARLHRLVTQVSRCLGCHPYFQSVEGSLSLPAAVSDNFICLGRYLLYARLDGAWNPAFYLGIQRACIQCDQICKSPYWLVSLRWKIYIRSKSTALLDTARLRSNEMSFFFIFGLYNHSSPKRIDS